MHLRLQSRQHIVLGMFRILTPVLYDLHSNLQQSRSYSPSTSWLVYTQISYISIFLRLLHINPQGHNYNIRCRLLETWKASHIHMPLHEFMRQNMHYRKKKGWNRETGLEIWHCPDRYECIQTTVNRSKMSCTFCHTPKKASAWETCRKLTSSVPTTFASKPPVSNLQVPCKGSLVTCKGGNQNFKHFIISCDSYLSLHDIYFDLLSRHACCRQWMLRLEGAYCYKAFAADWQSVLPKHTPF